jgi:hypothetical protein
MNSVVIIILGIIIVILIFVLYVYYNSSISPLIEYIALNETGQTSIPTKDIVNPLSTRFAYSIWIYVNTWKLPSNGEVIKSFFYRSKEVGLAFDKTKPILYCYFNNDAGLKDNNDAKNTIIISNNFPIQTWTNVILNVDNNYLDIYINGQLINSVILPKQYQPQTNTDITLIGNSTDIYLANIKRWGVSINPQTAYYDYLNGLQKLPKDSSSYNFKLSLLKDNNLINSLKL